MALRLCSANGRSDWTGWKVFWFLVTKGRYVDWWSLLRTYIAPLLLYGLVVLAVLL